MKKRDYVKDKKAVSSGSRGYDSIACVQQAGVAKPIRAVRIRMGIRRQKSAPNNLPDEVTAHLDARPRIGTSETRKREEGVVQ